MCELPGYVAVWGAWTGKLDYFLRRYEQRIPEALEES
jgi:hypothetical protein